MHLYQEAERFINQEFHRATADKSLVLDLTDLVAEQLVKENAAKDPEYYSHRAGVVHVTSLSKCLRGVAYQLLGHEPTTPSDARKLGVFKAGNMFEEWMVKVLGSRMHSRQNEYILPYEGLVLTGRDDGEVTFADGQLRVFECKSVHSDSFWYREREGTQVQWGNQTQLQTYLWLRRILTRTYSVIYGEIEKGEHKISRKGTLFTLDTPEAAAYAEAYLKSRSDVLQFELCDRDPRFDSIQGFFGYVSKDDCTTSSAAILYNPEIIAHVIVPALDLLAAAYKAKDPTIVPVPDLAVYSQAKNQWQKNYLCTRCDYHELCAGRGWVMEAAGIVATRNKEEKAAMVNPFAEKSKPQIQVVTPPTQ